MRNLRFYLPALLVGMLSIGPGFTPSAYGAEWGFVGAIPAQPLASVWAKGDTILAGGASLAFVSTNTGLSWKTTASPAPGATGIEAIRVRNGRLYAGTFGQGVRISDDLGTSWQAFNEGLVGGFEDSQLKVVDLQFRGDVLYAATSGAGVYARNLAAPGGWQPFGAAFELNQGANVTALAVGGDRLLASAGGNGMVFHRDPGEPEWTVSNLDNVGPHAGIQAGLAEWTGTGWVVGTISGVFCSVAGQEPWTRVNLGLGPVSWTAFATQGGHLFGAFDVPNFAVGAESSDNGATWTDLDVLPGVFVFQMAISGSGLFAARNDGLWRLPITLVADVPHAGSAALRFVNSGAHPVHEQARLHFELPEAGTASIQVFDVMGRSTGDRVEQWWSAGPHDVSLDASHLSPGVYNAQLTAGGRHEVLRLVHVQ
jgi:hypothetical protein